MRTALLAVCAALLVSPAAAYTDYVVEIPIAGAPVATSDGSAERVAAKRAKIAQAAAPSASGLNPAFQERDCYGAILAEGLLYVCTAAGWPQQILKVGPAELKAVGIVLVVEGERVSVLDSQFARAEGQSAEQRLEAATVSQFDVTRGFELAVRADRARKREAAAAETLRRMEESLKPDAPAHTLF